jgi:hypothetical protein
MAGKRESLREGKAVELEPGVHGRLNFQDKTLELSDGRKLSISEKDKRAIFPANEESKKHAQKVEEIERGIKKTPFGEFFHQIGQKGALGGIKDISDKITHTGDEYLRLKRAEREVGERIGEESPWTSRGATAASLAGELALTKGLSAAKAAPILTGLSAGSRVFEEPLQVAGEAAISSAGGKILDVGTNYLGKIAARRAASRAIPEQQAVIRAQNIAGEAETAVKNAQSREAFQRESRFSESENAARTHQYNLEVTARKNEMLKAQQNYEQAKAAHAANVNSLKEEAKNATQKYEDSIRKIPEIQREAQRQFSQNLEGTFKEIENSFPKDTTIPTDELNVWGFYNDYVQKNGLVGSAEARQNQQLFRSLFPNGKNLTPKEFGDRLRSIEASIGRSSPESQKLLGEFKEYLTLKAPPILGESIIARSTIPKIANAIEGEISSMMKGDPFKGFTTKSSEISSEIKKSMNDYVRSMTPKELNAKIQSGEFANDVKTKIFSQEKFESLLFNSEKIKLLKESGNWKDYKGAQEFSIPSKAYESFVNNLAQRAENASARVQLTGTKEAQTAQANLTEKLKKTRGMAEPVKIPAEPAVPIFPEAPTAPIEPPLPLKPTQTPQPSNPIPETFLAQPEPNLAAPQNFAESAGDFLEKPLLKGKGNTNNLLKLGALKYALGPAALPLEATALGGYGAAKLLTSPGKAGEAARLSFKQAGIQAIEQLAQKYPSYRNGVLESPQERRSLNKEIEDDQEIPIEKKAIIQSNVNRGKPLSSALR